MKILIGRSVGLLVAAGALFALAPGIANAQAQYGRGGYQQGGYGGYGGGYGGGGGYQNGGGFGAGGIGGGVGSTFGSAMAPTRFGALGSGSGGYGQQGGQYGSGLGSGFGQFGGGQFGGGQFGGGIGGYGQGGYGQGGAGQRNFVGRDAGEVINGFQQQFGGGRQGQAFNDVIQNFNDLRESRRRWREQRNVPPPVRVQLRPQIDVPAPAPGAIQADVQRMVTSALKDANIGQATVTVTPRATVLTGTVATPRDRALIERLVSLEPGIGAIDNQLTVAEVPQQAAAPAPAPQ